MQNMVNVTSYRKKCQQFQATFEKSGRVKAIVKGFLVPERRHSSARAACLPDPAHIFIIRAGLTTDEGNGYREI